MGRRAEGMKMYMINVHDIYKRILFFAKPVLFATNVFQNMIEK